MTSSAKTILITGANRGIGLAIIQSLATHPETSSATLLMGCRDTAKGKAAIKELQSSNPSINVSNIHPIEIDVTSDTSIRNAVSAVASEYGQLDVLINNAGFAVIPKASDHADLRSSFTLALDVNVSSVCVVTTLFLPLLRSSPSGNPKVINISSARGSLTRSSTGLLPPTAVVAYSVSKTALNALTVEMSRPEENQGVEFQLACPGHCCTVFNGFRGTRDPIEGADVVVEIVCADRRPTGCWETVGSDRVLREVPW